MAGDLCPTCGRRFEEAGFCPFDGSALTPQDPDEALAPPGEPPGNEYDQLVGQTLDGRYHLESKIGEGRMGVVFRARHAVIERPLAIKVLKRDAMRDTATIRRFVQEAQAASRIGHPNIVDVTDFGTTPDGMTYSVMELVSGHTLGAALRTGAPFAPARAIRITAQIARALAAAHDKGIVHRDLRPENVFLLDRDGRPDFVKIVDFGIAKVTPADGKPAERRLTRVGSVLGTPEYMAPEQAAGRGDTDGRVDIYALGVILYEMLCARVPHRGDSMVRTLTMQMVDPAAPPSKVRPDLAIAPALEALVMRALAKKLEQRYPTMGELVAALEALPPAPGAATVTGGPLSALPPGAGPAAVPSRPARAPLAIGLALLAGGAASAVGLAVKHGGAGGAGRDAEVTLVARDAGTATARADAAPDAADPVAIAVLDAGPVVGPTVRRDAGPASPISPVAADPPNHRGTIRVQVLTRPEGASLYDGTHYRGPGGTELEEPLGKKLVITCRHPGYKPGTAQVSFHKDATAVLCVMQRIKICIDGIKNPFDDCELAPAGAPSDAPRDASLAAPGATPNR